MRPLPTVQNTLEGALSRVTHPPSAGRRRGGSKPVAVDDDPPAQPAARGVDEFEPATYPPFETVRPDEAEPEFRSYGLNVLNDGPKRKLAVTISGAGVGDLFDDARLVESGDVIRFELPRADAYEVRVHAPGRPRYVFEVDPEWFDRDAGVANVVVGSDGYVRYSPL